MFCLAAVLEKMANYKTYPAFLLCLTAHRSVFGSTEVLFFCKESQQYTSEMGSGICLGKLQKGYVQQPLTILGDISTVIVEIFTYDQLKYGFDSPLYLRWHPHTR